MFGQDAPFRPEFEVASVKRVPPSVGPVAIGAIWAQDRSYYSMSVDSLLVKGLTVTLRNCTLLQLVASAHRMRMTEVTGAGWMSDLRFDIEAKLPAGARPGSANEMLQALLEDRFALRTHREARNIPGFALVVGKDGPHLAPPAPVPESSGPPDADELGRRLKKLTARGPRAAGVGMWYSNNATSAEIAEAVFRMVHVPVVDETSLDGRYEVSLDVPPPESPDDPWDYRVKQALAKLGLKLEPRKVTVLMLVVDAASKMPKEN